MTLTPPEGDDFEPDPADLCPTCHVEYVMVTGRRKPNLAQIERAEASILTCPSCGMRKAD